MTPRRGTATTNNARIDQANAQRTIDRITGMRVDRALHQLHFHPQHACEPVHRLITAALADLQRHDAAITAANLIIVAGKVGDGQTVTRVRRHAHGNADWISTHTTRIQIELSPPDARRSS